MKVHTDVIIETSVTRLQTIATVYTQDRQDTRTHTWAHSHKGTQRHTRTHVSAHAHNTTCDIPSFSSCPFLSLHSLLSQRLSLFFLFFLSVYLFSFSSFSASISFLSLLSQSLFIFFLFLLCIVALLCCCACLLSPESTPHSTHLLKRESIAALAAALVAADTLFRSISSPAIDSSMSIDSSIIVIDN